MPVTNYPGGFAGGVSLQGLPVLNTHSGKVFWVHSGSGSNQYKGTFRRPFATIDKAFDTGFVSANRGDIVMVKAGHTETIATDGGLTCDVAGVAIVGLGGQTSRPTLTINGLAAAVVVVSAADITLHNILFLGNKSDLVACLEIAGDSCEVSNCEFRELGASAGMETAIQIGVAAGDADYCHIHDCKFRMDEPGVTNVGDAAIEIIEDHDNIVIENNWIHGDFDDAGIYVPTAGNACDHLVIRGNYVENTKAGLRAIHITTAGTMVGGALIDNRVVADKHATLFEPHTLQCLGNIGNLGVTGSGDFPVPGYLVGSRGSRVEVNTLTFTEAAHEIGAVTLFTVTGVVMCRAWGHVTTILESDAGNDGTIELGTEADPNALCSVVVVNQTNMAANDVWAKATTTENSDFLLNTDEYYLIDGANIEIVMAVEDMTAGVIAVNVEWWPVSSNGDVVST